MALSKDIIKIGCCGAYCKTCPEFVKERCPGCKLGYESGKRDISKIRCKIKACCFRERGFQTCADCPDYSACETIHGLYAKNGYKYKKYQQAMEFLRKNGYSGFIAASRNWKCQYGKFC
ncbi:MAG: hypothetical protein A2V52_00370 [Actinobacteria bacterium RBG_19FT_COMBO_54_7]|uniref:DUF3795 domain-containing protein n=1 Tax=Candidatus Solincola sediminis TaxID=1797199 RepID=A0A1F2WT18_9ACTN|nr:MAG: hypothetical protein A2Y75_07765 [Candidatus Solincola sediminis]OFW60212.1 MAG: hypothetical protein A2W01_08720 [Candidatus Solincola sediminis]OFW66949.1 MAG: hypothetical protein A2V52_00370 [Actinobacteria bacterium RBG_19FT_COMBO_54_7]